MKRLTEKALKDILRQEYEREDESIAIHDCIGEILRKKWNSKKINARLAEQVKKALSEMFGKEPVVYYDNNPAIGQLYLKIWNTPHYPTFDHATRHFVGYHSSDLSAYDPNVFEDRDCANGNPAKERNEKRAAMMHGDNSGVLGVVNAYLYAKSEIDRVSSLDIPDWYDIQRAVGILS
jgi:hypothetical protein